MTTKLTLSINERTVQRAKILSRKRGKSISRIVEEYLDSISEKEEQKENPMTEIREVISKYKGKITLPADGNYNKMVRDSKYEDYIKRFTAKAKKK